MMQVNVVKTKYASYRIEEGILYIVYNPGLIILPDIADEMIEERCRMCNGKIIPVLVDIRNLISVDNISRKKFVSGESIANVAAAVLIVDSLVSRMIGNMYVMVDRPEIPLRLFSDEKKAVKWLQKYL